MIYCKYAATGVGQTWQDVVGDRSNNVVYTNTTGRPILVSIRPRPRSGSAGSASIEVDGVLLGITKEDVDAIYLVPAGSNYKVNFVTNLTWYWRELR